MRFSKQAKAFAVAAAGLLTMGAAPAVYGPQNVECADAERDQVFSLSRQANHLYTLSYAETAPALDDKYNAGPLVLDRDMACAFSATKSGISFLRCTASMRQEEVTGKSGRPGRKNVAGLFEVQVDETARSSIGAGLEQETSIRARYATEGLAFGEHLRPVRVEAIGVKFGGKRSYEFNPTFLGVTVPAPGCSLR